MTVLGLAWLMVLQIVLNSVFFTFHKNSRIEEKELETGIRGNNGKAQSFNKNNAMSQTVKFL